MGGLGKWNTVPTSIGNNLKRRPLLYQGYSHSDYRKAISGLTLRSKRGEQFCSQQSLLQILNEQPNESAMLWHKIRHDNAAPSSAKSAVVRFHIFGHYVCHVSDMEIRFFLNWKRILPKKNFRRSTSLPSLLSTFDSTAELWTKQMSKRSEIENETVKLRGFIMKDVSPASIMMCIVDNCNIRQNSERSEAIN